MTPRPVASPPSSGPVVGRPVGEVRADLAAMNDWALSLEANGEAAVRLARDVPSLLAEVEAVTAAYVDAQRRWSDEVVRLRGVVQAVQALVRRARFDPGPAGVRHPETRLPFVYTDDLRAALAAAADAPQPKPDDGMRGRVEAVIARYRDYRGGFDQIRQERADFADVLQAALDGDEELLRVARLQRRSGSSPAVPPEKEHQR